jgi:hypothetical protein
METFRGKAHLPGADREWSVDMELDWDLKEVLVHINEAPGGVKSWPGLVVQTFGTYELAFKTKGIPALLTHWWHFVRADDDLWGIVVGLPDPEGKWSTCAVALKKVD